MKAWTNDSWIWPYNSSSLKKIIIKAEYLSSFGYCLGISYIYKYIYCGNVCLVMLCKNIDIRLDVWFNLRDNTVRFWSIEWRHVVLDIICTWTHHVYFIRIYITCEDLIHFIFMKPVCTVDPDPDNTALAGFSIIKIWTCISVRTNPRGWDSVFKNKFKWYIINL